MSKLELVILCYLIVLVLLSIDNLHEDVSMLDRVECIRVYTLLHIK